MGKYKYPYIPKEYYPAVMGACSYIRNKGYFNKAVAYYADKYNLDEDVLAMHIRKRQGAGQKASNKTRKYGYVALEFLQGINNDSCFYLDEPSEAQYDIRRATSIENAKRQLYGNDGFYSDYALNYLFCRCEMFENKKDAENAIKNWKKENSN